jgi:hypothetical protein
MKCSEEMSTMPVSVLPSWTLAFAMGCGVYDERSSCQTGGSISGGRTGLDSIHLCQVEISMAITSSVVDSMLHIPLTLSRVSKGGIDLNFSAASLYRQAINSIPS